MPVVLLKFGLTCLLHNIVNNEPILDYFFYIIFIIYWIICPFVELILIIKLQKNDHKKE